MRRLSDEEVLAIQQEAAGDDELGRFWRLLMSHAEGHGGDVERIIRATYGPLWGDHYIRHSVTVAYLLDLPHDLVAQTIGEIPHPDDATRPPVEESPSRARPAWWPDYQAECQRLLETARTEQWDVDRVQEAALELFAGHFPSVSTD